VEKGGPNQVTSERLLSCNMPGGLQTVALVIARLGKESLALEW